MRYTGSLIIILNILQDSESYKGVKLASGQELFSQKLVLDPSFTIPSPIANSSPDYLDNSSPVFGLRDVKGKVARGICITKTPLKPDLSSCLVFFPPRCEIIALYIPLAYLKLKIASLLTLFLSSSIPWAGGISPSSPAS